jgi:hypothetical protein
MRDLSKKFEIGINANVNFEKYFPEEYKDIVSKKPMNSYKGKGMRYANLFLKLKETKDAKKK